MAASNRDENPIEHLNIGIDSKDLQDLTEHEKQLETRTDAVRCPDCLTPIQEDRTNENWCINCAQPVHPHPTRKDEEWRTPLENRFWEREKVNILEPDQCWPWKAAKSKDGYGAIKVSGTTRRAHRVAVMLDRDLNRYEDVPGEVVMHSCDNPGCVNTNHLQPGTQGTNCVDRLSRSGDTLVSPREVKEIRQYAAEGVPHKRIVEWYPLSQSMIEDIVYGNAYEWVKDD